MSRGIATTFSEWRFLLLTLLICAFLLTTPLIAGNWPVQMVLEALLLAMVLVTVSVNPGWHKLRRVLVVLWLVSVSGTLLSVFSIRPELWQWYRKVELLTLVPVLAVVATGMLAFVRRQRTLTIDSIFATVVAYLLQVGMTYFTLVILATVGYGDVLPATHTARMLAMFQAVVGQFYVAVVGTLGRIPGSLPAHGAVPPCGRVACLQRKFDISRVTCVTGEFATTCPGTSTRRRRRRAAAAHNNSTSRRTR